MIRHLFAYGTLQHPLVIHHILGRVPGSEKALLTNFVRYKIQGQNFPGIIPDSGKQTDGTLFFDITEAEWDRLDHYESDWYDRLPVQVCAAGNIMKPAYAYILPEKNRYLLSDAAWLLSEYQPDSD